MYLRDVRDINPEYVGVLAGIGIETVKDFFAADYQKLKTVINHGAYLTIRKKIRRMGIAASEISAEEQASLDANAQLIQQIKTTVYRTVFHNTKGNEGKVILHPGVGYPTRKTVSWDHGYFIPADEQERFAMHNIAQMDHSIVEEEWAQ